MEMYRESKVRQGRPLGSAGVIYRRATVHSCEDSVAPLPLLIFTSMLISISGDCQNFMEC